MAAPKKSTPKPMKKGSPAKGGPKWTNAKDAAADKRAGVKPGSKRDNAIDKKRGVK